MQCSTIKEFISLTHSRPSWRWCFLMSKKYMHYLQEHKFHPSINLCSSFYLVENFIFGMDGLVALVCLGSWLVGLWRGEFEGYRMELLTIRGVDALWNVNSRACDLELVSSTTRCRVPNSYLLTRVPIPTQGRVLQITLETNFFKIQKLVFLISSYILINCHKVYVFTQFDDVSLARALKY